MKGRHIIIFLLVVFLTPVILYAVERPGNINKTVTPSFNTTAHAYAKKIEQDRLPAIIEDSHFFSAAFSSTNNGAHKSISCYKIYSDPFNNTSSGLSFLNGTNNFFHRKNIFFVFIPHMIFGSISRLSFASL